MQGIRIGELLVEQGLLTERQVNHILAVQRNVTRPFGDLAERLFGIAPQVIEDAWVEQYARSMPTIDLTELEADKQCLRLINRRQAWQFQIAPFQRDEENISIATTSDKLVRAVNYAARKFDQPVYFVLSEKKQLREFLMKHYPVPNYIAEFAETF